MNNGTHKNAYIITTIFHKSVLGAISPNHMVAIVVVVKYKEFIKLRHSTNQKINHHKKITHKTNNISRNKTFLRNDFHCDFIFIILSINFRYTLF
jgi:hypothetical protein